MKKFYFLTAALLAAPMVFSQLSYDTITFESWDLGTNEYYNGDTTLNGFYIGQVIFPNNLSYSEWGGVTYESWAGFAVSKVKNDTTPGMTNQFAAYTNGGANGSAQYGIFYQGYSGNDVIEFSTPRFIKSIDVTNTTYAALSMLNGDSFSKKFGTPTNANGEVDGTNGEDFFLLQIMRLDQNDNLVGDTINFYLADYRFAEDELDYIVNTWETIDLGNLVAKKLKFKLSSSDVNQYGMNTPAYFALDNIVYNTSLGLKSNSQLIASIYPNPVQDVLNVSIENNAELKLVNNLGQVVLTENVNKQSKIDVSNLQAGVYQLMLTSEVGAYTQKVVIR